MPLAPPPPPPPLKPPLACPPAHPAPRSLMRDVAAAQQRPRAPQGMWLGPPLVVMNNFGPAPGGGGKAQGGAGQQLQLATALFQSLFPAINVQVGAPVPLKSYSLPREWPPATLLPSDAAAAAAAVDAREHPRHPSLLPGCAPCPPPTHTTTTSTWTPAPAPPPDGQAGSLPACAAARPRSADGAHQPAPLLHCRCSQRRDQERQGGLCEGVRLCGTGPF